MVDLMVGPDGTPIIKWRKMDENIRLAHEKKVKSSRKPSMWEYDPKGEVPTELANLDSSTFSKGQLGQVLFSLPKDIFIRICSMLSVHDFIHFSSTCRFLHWKMFTFCTCYVPCSVNAGVHDDSRKMNPDQPKLTYSLSKNIMHRAAKGSDDWQFIRQYVLQQKGERGIFVYRPFCLRKPFFFETLEMAIKLPFNYKQFYDRILPHILAVRGLVRHLNLTLHNEYDCLGKTFIFNYSDTNDFLKAINASFYKNAYVLPDGSNATMYNKDIYLNCPYARQMHRVELTVPYRRDTIDVPVFQNPIGIYMWPLDSAVKATLQNFLTGSSDVVFHQYLQIEKNHGRYPLIEYLLREFGQFEEFLCLQKYEDVKTYYFLFYVWKKVVVTENGGQIRILIEKETKGGGANRVTIGKEEKFEEIDKKFTLQPLSSEGNTWWKMETAVEPNETEKSEEDEESDEMMDSDVFDESDELEDSDEGEEQQGAFEFCSFRSIL